LKKKERRITGRSEYLIPRETRLTSATVSQRYGSCGAAPRVL